MISSDEAIALGCEKYREIYPLGLIPDHLENEACLGVTPGNVLTVHATFCVEGKRDPYCLFEVKIDRLNGTVTVQIADDRHKLETMTFAHCNHVT